MSVGEFDKMTREELVNRLSALETSAKDYAPRPGETVPHLVHDLMVHQVELEMQNRALRETQELLEESRARYADLYDFAPVGYCTLDDKGRISEINLTAAALIGAERDSLLGRPFASVAGLVDRNAFRLHLATCMRRAGRVTTEVVLAQKGRSEVVVQMASTPILDVAGEVVGSRTALTDVTARKRVEEAMGFLAAASSALGSSLDYQATLNTLAHLGLQRLGDWCTVDVTAEEGLRRVASAHVDPAKEKLARNSTTLVPAIAEDGHRALETGKSVFHAPPPDAPITEPPRPDDLRARSWMCVPLQARGRSLGVVTFASKTRELSAMDLSLAEELVAHAALSIDNARLYEEAQRAVAMRQDILAVVSHDLRNPLNAIGMTTEILKAAVPEDDRRKYGRKHLEAIARAAKRMNRMIDDLLDLSRIDAGHLSVDKKREEVAALLAEALEQMQPIAREKSIPIESRTAPDVGFVLCDRDRVLQALSNVIGNAIKFSGHGASIEVSAERQGNEIRFAVRDRGCGIKAPLLRKIFDRYWQAGDQTQHGAGLGLFITKGIVEVHAGRIWAESEPGAGSTFYFTLPATE